MERAMGLGDRVRRRVLRNSEFVGLTRMRFDGTRVAFVDEWTDLSPGARRWWQIFGACSHAMHIANNLGPHDVRARAIRDVIVVHDPPITDLAADFEVVGALPGSSDEMGLEVWAGAALPIVQSTLAGRSAKKGRYALPAAGLPFVHLLAEIDADDLVFAVNAHGEAIERLGWEPGDRRTGITVQILAMAEVAAAGIADDVYGLAGEFAENQQPPRTVLLEASDRLDEHLLDGDYDDYFKLVLLACSASGYRLLADAAEWAHDDELSDSVAPLAVLLDTPAPADRAVRTATWLVLCGVVAERWADSWTTVVDLASTAMPLDPRGLEAVARQISLHRDESPPASLGEVSTAWLEQSLRLDALSASRAWATRWSGALLASADEYAVRLAELEARYPDVLPD